MLFAMFYIDTAKNSVLHDQFDSSMCQYQSTDAARVLSASRLWREDIYLYLYYALTQVCVSVELKIFKQIDK